MSELFGGRRRIALTAIALLFTPASSARAQLSPNPIINIDLPSQGAVVTQPFALTGWALDANATTGKPASARSMYGHSPRRSGTIRQYLHNLLVCPTSATDQKSVPFGVAVHPLGIRVGRVGATARLVQLPAVRLGRCHGRVRHRPDGGRHDRVSSVIEYAARDRSASEQLDGQSAVSPGGMGDRHGGAGRHRHRHNPRLGVPDYGRSTSLRRRT